MSYGFYSPLQVQEVLKRVSEGSLWRFYLGFDYELKRGFSSPLRIGDDNPSFNIYEDKRGRLMFKDFGGEALHGDIFDYLQKRDSLDLTEALVKVNVDFKLGLGKPEQQAYTGSKPLSKRTMDTLEKFEDKLAMQTAPTIKVWTRDHSEADVLYWLQYGITIATLNYYKVHCLRRIEVNGRLVYTHSDDNPCYSYSFPSKHIKCYFPKATGEQFRFLGNANNYEDIQGYHQCNVKKDKNNKLLILTKSMKDVMCLRELGYEAMAIHGEGQYFYKDFIRHIKKYYPNIISMYDRDKTGVKGMKYLWTTYGISAVFIPKALAKQGIKDISDMYKALGREKTEEFLKAFTGIYIADEAIIKDQ